MAQGMIEQYQDNQLVVAISDLAVVCGALNNVLKDEIPFEAGRPDRNDQLGLALLTLQNVDAIAEKLCADRSGLRERVKARRRDGTEPPGLDLLISWLREHFSCAYDEWVPTIGKNRVIDPVRGLPYVGGGGEGDPHFGGFGDPTTGPKPKSGANGGPSAAGPHEAGSSLGWKPRQATPGQGVRVGVLDTQLYPNQWLAGGYLAAGDDLLADPAGDPALPASAGHATFIAGLILHQAPGAELVVRPVLDEEAVGKAWDVAKHMASFIGSGVDILNLSFGCYTADDQPPLVLARAVSRISAEILLVAAAGNHGNIDQLKKQGVLKNAAWAEGLTPKTPVWPAAFDEVIAVGATDGDEPADFSPRTPWVDMTAPGVNVLSTYLKGQVTLGDPDGRAPDGRKTETFADGFAYWDGTSFAAATLSGAVAAGIQRGRCSAREALESLQKAPVGNIRPFTKPVR